MKTSKKKTTKQSKQKKTAIGSHMLGRPAIVRANVAGVHAGILAEIDGDSVVLKGARRLWRYYTVADKTGSITEIALTGLAPKEKHRIGAALPSVYINNPRGLEVAEMTDLAWKSVRDWMEPA